MVQVVDILNRVLSAEQGGLAERLLESTMFVSDASLQGAELVRRMAGESRRHCAALAGMVTLLGGAPASRRLDALSSDLHFQELGFVLPRVAAAEAALVFEYRSSASVLGDVPEAAKLVSGMADAHEKNLLQLRKLIGVQAGARA
ncbi:MAG: hypothetical protein AABZ12_01870 [Planctomycetota bacterium]